VLYTIADMKYFFQLIIIFSLFSCEFEKEKSYCENQLRLLRSNSYNTAIFDFNLEDKEQIKNLQNQIEFSICQGMTQINATFKVGQSEINTLLVTDWRCKDSLKKDDLIPASCVLIRSKQVLINKQGKIMIDGDVTPIESIANKTAKISENYFWDNSYRLVAFEIQWDSETNIEVKENVFQELINGYLKSADNISMRLFNQSICELDSTQIDELKSDFKFSYLIEQKRPIPPVPIEESKMIEKLLQSK
jgi:hypothetical protein